MKTIKQKEKFFNKISEQLQFDIIDYFNNDDLENINNYEDLYYELQDQTAFDINIIYYYKAMQYLIEHDTSLSDSMALADEFGFEPKNINSELLASLLASEYARDEFAKLEDKIEKFFNN